MSKASAVLVRATGGPDVLGLEDVEVQDPGPGQITLRQTAIGVNFIDVYHRRGSYPLPLPTGIGQEAAGVVEAVGPGVVDLAPGDRVAYAGLLGAYATARIAPADCVVKLPATVSDTIAAASMLKGMTARTLLRATTKVERGDTIVVHAAAGATGQLLVQWAAHLGATVIAVVGSEAKAEIAKSLGAHHVAVRGREDFVDVALAATNGRGADVVYDSVGKDTFAQSLACLRVRGLMVSFGQASGPIAPLEISALAKKCLYLTRPTLFAYTATRAELLETAADLFDVLARGVVRVTIDRTYALTNVARAHEELEARKTAGSIVLEP